MRRQHTGPDTPRPGKKPGVHGKKINKMHSLSPDIVEFLASLDNASGFVEQLVRKSPAFKKWSEGRYG